jgi:1-pyrroline-5-carboxylate dehydrogenase
MFFSSGQTGIGVPIMEPHVRQGRGVGMTSDGQLPSPEAVGPTPSRDHTPGSPARAALDQALASVLSESVDVPCVVGGLEVRTGRTAPIVAPHDTSAALGQVHHGSAVEVTRAIDAALEASRTWARAPWQERAAVFLRAADLIEASPWRDRLDAATMLELSKTSAEADGDAGCETADFLRANVANMQRMYADQPASVPGVDNVMDYRPLEGFVLAVSPFNFTSMNNLAFGPALLGNTVVWKPAEAASLVAHLSLQVLREAGLPDGVVNLVPGSGAELGPVALTHPALAAVAFTGSTATFQSIWETVGANVRHYRSYPRLVGETGGKGFVLVHPSADVDAVAEGVVRAAYGYQGQKCSAASRLYVPWSLWPDLRERLVERTRALTMGDPTIPEVDLGAVISERQFRMHDKALARARAETRVLVGGAVEADRGWFVEPTLLEVDDPHSCFMTQELFGPILSAYVYQDPDWESVVRLVDESTIYGLTGAVYAHDDAALRQADELLRYAAGNYYVNDKPSGAIVGQQPFGGARASGTDDKVGTVWNLIRFTSPRSTKRQHRRP